MLLVGVRHCCSQCHQSTQLDAAPLLANGAVPTSLWVPPLVGAPGHLWAASAALLLWHADNISKATLCSEPTPWPGDSPSSCSRIKSILEAGKTGTSATEEKGRGDLKGPLSPSILVLDDPSTHWHEGIASVTAHLAMSMSAASTLGLFMRAASVGLCCRRSISWAASRPAWWEACRPAAILEGSKPENMCARP